MDSRIIYVCPNYKDYEFKTKRIWRTDGKYEPFVYIIQEVETEMMYIGSKTQYKGRPCLESWLGTKYFTSSEQFDWESNPGSFEICKIISCASNHDAIILEGLLIEQNGAVWCSNYYNMYHHTVGFNTSGMTLYYNPEVNNTQRFFNEAPEGWLRGSAFKYLWVYDIEKDSEYRIKVDLYSHNDSLLRNCRPKMSELFKGSSIYYDPENKSHTRILKDQFPPDYYIKGRVDDKIWINNGYVEKLIDRNETIKEGYEVGRLEYNWIVNTENFDVRQLRKGDELPKGYEYGRAISYIKDKRLYKNKFTNEQKYFYSCPSDEWVEGDGFVLGSLWAYNKQSDHLIRINDKNELSEGYKLGHGGKIGECNKGKLIYFNKETEEIKRFTQEEAKMLDNRWIRGFGNSRDLSGSIMYHNKHTKEIRFMKEGDNVPDDFIKGKPFKMVWYHHEDTGKNIYIKDTDEIPQGFVRGRCMKSRYINKETGEIKKFSKFDKIEDGFERMKWGA